MSIKSAKESEGEPSGYAPRFRPTLRTAQFAVQALAEGSTRLDITSRYVPPSPDAPINYERVRDLIGNQTLGFLGSYSQYYAPDEGSIDATVLGPDKQFAAEMQEDLGDMLGLDRDKEAAYGGFMSALGEELYAWAQADQEYLPQVGARLTDNHALVLRCELLKPDVPPLEEPLEAQIPPS